MDSDSLRMERLLSDILDGRAVDEVRDELATLLNEKPELIPQFAEELSVHSLLQWQTEDVTGDIVAYGLESADRDAPALAMQASGAGPAETPVRRSWLWAAAGIATLCAGTVWWSLVDRGRGPAAVAKIADEQGVTWSDDSTARGSGRLVYPGRLKTTSGAFTLQFTSGAIVRVVGASTLNVESAMLVGLERGQATARVTELSKGFTLRTPVVNVVDQGTQFGVAIGEDGKTDVVVFEGAVDLHDAKDAAARQTRLVQGEAVRIDAAGAIGRLMQVQRDAKGGWWSRQHLDFSGREIKEVRDNIPPSDGSKYFCYQITYQGLEDDVTAYADHPHQWNGLTAKGLPDFLRGADFVKTFNDYRYKTDFEMTIELSRAANLYVFFDDRVATPDWLEEQFENTGVRIGLDEGPWKGIPDHASAVGGGNSIDNVFTVWHRRCIEPSSVTLGNMGPIKGLEPTGRAMYGIAATPLDRDDAMASYASWAKVSRSERMMVAVEKGGLLRGAPDCGIERLASEVAESIELKLHGL